VSGSRRGPEERPDVNAGDTCEVAHIERGSGDQQGTHQGGYFDEIAIDPINLQPGDEEIIAIRLREELTKQ
jgi:hypothetical protein